VRIVGGYSGEDLFRGHSSKRSVVDELDVSLETFGTRLLDLSADRVPRRLVAEVRSEDRGIIGDGQLHHRITVAKSA